METPPPPPNAGTIVEATTIAAAGELQRVARSVCCGSQSGDHTKAPASGNEITEAPTVQTGGADAITSTRVGGTTTAGSAQPQVDSNHIQSLLAEFQQLLSTVGEHERSPEADPMVLEATAQHQQHSESDTDQGPWATIQKTPAQELHGNCRPVPNTHPEQIAAHSSTNSELQQAQPPTRAVLQETTMDGGPVSSQDFLNLITTPVPANSSLAETPTPRTRRKTRQDSTILHRSRRIECGGT